MNCFSLFMSILGICACSSFPIWWYLHLYHRLTMIKRDIKIYNKPLLHQIVVIPYRTLSFQTNFSKFHIPIPNEQWKLGITIPPTKAQQSSFPALGRAQLVQILADRSILTFSNKKPNYFQCEVLISRGLSDLLDLYRLVFSEISTYHAFKSTELPARFSWSLKCRSKILKRIHRISTYQEP